MTATDELRRMLDERGVRWTACSKATIDNQTFCRRYTYTEFQDGLMVSNLTPEQAIEATLGRGTCHIKDGNCDQCGAIIRDKAVAFLTPTRQGIRMVEKYDASYCPNCGRKIEP